MLSRTSSSSLAFARSTAYANPRQLQLLRWKSTSPYGRTHLKKPRQLPNPIVPQFKQRVFLSDGSSFTHFTTSPKTTVRLTRDMANNPFWSPGSEDVRGGDDESGRLGRFKRRFADENGSDIDLDNLAEASGISVQQDAAAARKLASKK